MVELVFAYILYYVFVFNYSPTTLIYTYGHSLSLHPALPCCGFALQGAALSVAFGVPAGERAEGSRAVLERRECRRSAAADRSARRRDRRIVPGDAGSELLRGRARSHCPRPFRRRTPSPQPARAKAPPWLRRLGAGARCGDLPVRQLGQEPCWEGACQSMYI